MIVEGGIIQYPIDIKPTAADCRMHLLNEHRTFWEEEGAWGGFDENTPVVQQATEWQMHSPPG